MTDIPQKALNLLIHDIRTPLSVAQGYVRLVREELLTDPDERNRALAQTAEALGRIARLCVDASNLADLAAAPDAMLGPPVALSLVVASLISEASTWNLEMQIADLSSVATAAAEPRLMGDALLTVATARRAGPSGRVLAVSQLGLLRIGLPAELEALGAGPDSACAEPFDSWTGGHGLQLPMATLRLQRHGARIWTMRAAPGTLGIQFPLATQP